MVYKTEDVTIVIPNYNGRLLLEKNLPSVCKAAKQAEIIVVDDGSVDGSVQVLHQKFPDIICISKSKNEGFASAVNLGVSKSKRAIIVLLNSDVVPAENFLSFLLPHFENQRMFAVGCMDESIEQKKKIYRGRGEAFWHKGFYIHRRGDVDKTDTAWVSGGSGAFKKSFWEKLGGLDTIYNPFYWEDIDLSYRAKKSGFLIYFESKSLVIHHHDEGSIKTSRTEYAVKKIAYRNQFIFIWKNISNNSYLFDHIVHLPVRLLRALITGDYAFFLGLILALGKVGPIIQRRSQLKSLFVKNDSELLNSPLL